MDGMIFLRGVFIDRSVKNVTLYVEDLAHRITVINNISSIKVYNNENMIFQTSLFNNFSNLIIKNENNNLQVNISI